MLSMSTRWQQKYAVPRRVSPVAMANLWNVGTVGKFDVDGSEEENNMAGQDMHNFNSVVWLTVLW